MSGGNLASELEYEVKYTQNFENEFCILFSYNLKNFSLVTY